MRIAGLLPALVLLGGAAPVAAAELTADVRSLTQMGTESSMGSLGKVTFADGAQGVELTTDLEGLPPGQHGLHLHTRGECGPGPDPQGRTIPGGAAAGHWDPSGSGKHLGPQGEGHMGDLPVLEVAADGTAKATLAAPRIKSLDELDGKAIMVHAGGDNYKDEPQPLGGGGARLACGVIGQGG